MTPAKAEAEVDRFLAAPEEVVTDAREREKLVERKRRDDARLEREQRSKAKQAPTREDLLADLVRVAESPDLNPYHEFRTLSKRRYELYGHWTIEQVVRLCGQFEHAKQQAGLATPVGERAFARARTAASLREHDARYAERWLLPHVDKFPELAREAAGWRCGLTISDLHGLLLDPFTWEAFLEACSHLQPDVVCFNGDVIDGSEISSFPKVPTATVPLQLEFDVARNFFREVRERLPRTPILWGAGNHFLDRLTRYLTQVAPGIAKLDSLRIDKLVALDDLDIELVQGGSFVSPRGTESAKPRKLLWNSYLVTHGTALGAHPAAAELAQWGVSGTSGHVHRASVHCGATHAHRGLTWMSTPAACVEDAGKWYVKGHAGWQRGFGVFFVGPGGQVRHHPVLTDGGVAAIEGLMLRARPGLPESERDVRAFWLARWGLDWGRYF